VPSARGTKKREQGEREGRAEESKEQGSQNSGQLKEVRIVSYDRIVQVAGGQTSARNTQKKKKESLKPIAGEIVEMTTQRKEDRSVDIGKDTEGVGGEMKDNASNTQKNTRKGGGGWGGKNRISKTAVGASTPRSHSGERRVLLETGARADTL